MEKQIKNIYDAGNVELAMYAAQGQNLSNEALQNAVGGTLNNIISLGDENEQMRRVAEIQAKYPHLSGAWLDKKSKGV